jgi:triosephosphate isomerase
VGEKERDHGGEYLSFLREQMHSAFRSVTRAQLQNMIIAYEPIYAIGKGADSAISSEDLHQTSLYLRKILTERYDRATALAVPLLYGGSVKANNTLALLEEGFVDGLLVGSASVAPKEFQEILRLAASLPVTTH